MADTSLKEQKWSGDRSLKKTSEYFWLPESRQHGARLFGCQSMFEDFGVSFRFNGGELTKIGCKGGIHF